ncbi:SAM-dependent chlorinase/fluorinase, partial [bacterium]|nr:SAM-dependent chlorinase/fluorinase [bacterium]
MRNNKTATPKIITFTSDFGLEDPFVGVVKGVILNINPNAIIVDITHLIPPQDILQAALVLRFSYRFFPPGTIHLAIVDPGVGSSRNPIVIESPPYFFVGPDNGIFSFVLEENFSAYLIENRQFLLPDISQTFHGRDIFAPIAGHLSLGVSPSCFGRKIEEIEKLAFPQPKIMGNTIVGQILTFDRFGNAITNISADLLGEHTNVKIKVKDTVIEGLRFSYSEKPPLAPL